MASASDGECSSFAWRKERESFESCGREASESGREGEESTRIRERNVRDDGNVNSEGSELISPRVSEEIELAQLEKEEKNSGVRSDGKD
jgi:hypothetical protein